MSSGATSGKTRVIDALGPEDEAGKMALGLRVAGPGGGNPSFWRAALRESIGMLVSLYVLCLSFLWMLWDGKQHTWHDKMAQTHVELAG